ncbi:hypothetical protein H4R35_007531 [Dimargaris xerosporica]|nr:hypothetical protein H4R35_007531 [Dimargaris xerosporica]
MDPPYGQEPPPPPPFGGPQRASSLYSAFPPSYSHDPYTHSGSAANRYPHDGGMFGAAPPLMGSATFHPLATGGYPPFGGQGSPPPPYAAEGDGFGPTGFGFPPR